jgi:hypothetical protein
MGHNCRVQKNSNILHAEMYVVPSLVLLFNPYLISMRLS